MPTAANAGYYAGIVAEKASLRRLVEAGTRVVQYGWPPGLRVPMSMKSSTAPSRDLRRHRERRTAEDFRPLEELLQPTMDDRRHRSNGGISAGCRRASPNSTR